MEFASIFRKLFPKPQSEYSDAELGAAGEKIAARHLEQSGYRILERNWRSRYGEIDIVCLHNDTLIFIEVKSSRRLGAFPPEIRVTFQKQRKLNSLARYYIKRHHLDFPIRFDIIAVWWKNEKPQIRHIENAF